MTVGDYIAVLDRQEDGLWVAQIPATSGWYALMETRNAALANLVKVFSMIADEYRDKGLSLPADSTEILHA